MKKIAKLSLVAAVAVAGLSTSAMAESLADAFANAKVKGEIKSQYFQKEAEAAGSKKQYSWANGGNLSITTGSFYGLTGGVTFQTAHTTAISENTDYLGDQNVSGSVMSEAYLAYTMGNTTAKVGRQFISTPLVAGSGSRIIREAFNGAVLINTDVPNTVLVAAYVDRFQGRTDGTDAPKFKKDFVVGNLTTVALDGAYTVYAKNTSIPNLAVQAQYAVANPEASGLENVKLMYADASYKLNPITISAQTYQTNNHVDKDGALYSVKVAGNIAGFNAMAAYSTSDDEADVITGLGNGADLPFVAGAILGGSNSADADTDAYKVALGYNFTNGLGLNASYTNWETGNNDDVSETNFTASYKFNKNLSTKIMYSTFDNYSFDYRSRVYVSYKF